MPSSKEVRARQNRQKERVAAAIAERQRARKFRQRIGVSVVIVAIVVVLILGLTLGGGSNKNNTVAVAPTTAPATTPPTTAPKPLASVKGKPCVGLKSALPKGSPAFLLAPGPAPTKLQTQDLKVGTGAVIAKNATVTVNYVGVACSTGKIFDSSYTDGSPFSANLSGGVIPGWQQGIPGMRIGGVRLLSIPSSLAYASAGQGTIAPDEALFFLVSAVKLG